MSTSDHPHFEYTPIRPPLVMMDKTIKWKPNKIELAPNCPRCTSSNTKFCYYNNYSVSQPRYFCKACRRYWTKGGSLRNVPIGGGCRKSRRSGSRPTRQDCPPPSLESKNESENCGDIDVAAVLAKYSNQNVENYEYSGCGSSEDVQIGDNTTIFECGKYVADYQFQYINGDQDFVYQNFDAFEVDGLLGSELWSEGTSLQSFGSQKPVMEQPQEFEVFSSDDQLRMSENLVTDNWGSFDLSGYENF